MLDGPKIVFLEGQSEQIPLKKGGILSLLMHRFPRLFRDQRRSVILILLFVFCCVAFSIYIVMRSTTPSGLSNSDVNIYADD